MANTFFIFSTPYLDKQCCQGECYKNIIVLSCKPNGPLSNMCRTVKPDKLSIFKGNTCRSSTRTLCMIAVKEITCEGEPAQNLNLMVLDDLPNLVQYLVLNGYKIDTSFTKMMHISNIKFDTNESKKFIFKVDFVKNNAV
jgi:hypothetical protein